MNRKSVIKNTCVSVGPEATIFYDESEIADMLLNVKTEDERWLLDYIWNKFYLRSVIQDKIEFDIALSLGEDFDFNCRAFSSVSSIMFVKDTVYDYTIRQTGLVTGFHEKPWLWRIQLFHSHIALYKKWGVLNSEREQEICKYEGMLDFSALRSINSERCKLSKSEKREHIEKMLGSEAFDLILFYLQRCSGYKKILYRLMKKKNRTMVNLVIFIDRIMRQ